MTPTDGRTATRGDEERGPVDTESSPGSPADAGLGGPSDPNSDKEPSLRVGTSSSLGTGSGPEGTAAGATDLAEADRAKSELRGGGSADGARPLRGSFHDQPLAVDELERLRALNAATSSRAETNLAVLDAIESLRVAYRPSARPEEIEARLRPGLVDDAEDLRGVLDRLTEWECVSAALDRSHRHVQRLSDFYRAQLVWQITPKGRAVLAAARGVLDAVELAGGLRRRIFGQLRARLDELVEGVDAGDAARTFLTLRDLDTDLGDLTRSAQDFTATLARLTETTDVDPAEFAAAKRVLVDYLASFSGDLYVFRGRLTERARTLDAFGAQRIGALAADGDDSATVALGGDQASAELAESWRVRWVGMSGWLAGGDGIASGADDLFEALTEATNSILAHVRRLSEAEQRRASRSGDLVTLAGWFVASDTDDADRLFDATFGLGQAPRLQGHSPESVSTRRPSWFDGPVAPVAISVRSRGASAGTGRMAKVVDFGAERRLLAEQAAADAQRRREAAATLAAGLGGAELPAAAFELLLDALGTALGGLRDTDRSEVVVEGVLVRLRRDPAGTTVCSTAGVLEAPGVAIEVTSADGTTTNGTGGGDGADRHEARSGL